MKKIFFGIAVVLLISIAGLTATVGYQLYKFTRPVETIALSTPWTENVDSQAPLPEYPRPQLRRDRWQSLNGLWQYTITPREAAAPTHFEGSIVVPFPIESLLSGVQRSLLPEDRLWYRRIFDTPPLEARERLILHFGAVDWEAEVWLNGTRIGVHQGGFDPFSFDITDALIKGVAQELVVAVWDPTNTGPGAVGKQHLVPHGIRYTAVSGIWQTVWLEPVPAQHILSVAVTATDLTAGSVTLAVESHDTEPGDEIEIEVRADGEIVTSARDDAPTERVSMQLLQPDLRAWSPEDPFLYELQVSLWRNGKLLDRVESYFGAREVGIARDSEGIWRLMLNGSAIFHLGLLDQGWWPDGLYTAPTDEALAFDIEATKKMGFNTIRKHVKVEPARWYWHADRLGVLVWQDMPTGSDRDASRFTQILDQAGDFFSAHLLNSKGVRLERSPESAAYFRQELASMMAGLKTFPSIVAWVPFNEAWGQFDTDEVLAEAAAMDPTRLIDGPSGWIDTGSGDIRDLHMYGREAEFISPLPPRRPLVYGEFGGLGYPFEGHLAVESGWGYSAFESQAAFEKAYVELLGLIESLRPLGLAGAIYTQTTDVESEINGLITYDRRQFKIPPQRLTEVNGRLTKKILPSAPMEK
ncbi:MAG: glycoside hydrolase family 2 TIM barrel-domain containing protein [Halioglobus sp.]|nr:glycoside hydrolase family 2 TIM barrel-domain containing protein [Halioglobus sp.]